MPFKKGQSGNPAGKPKGAGTHVARCKEWAEREGWSRLEEMTRCGDKKIELEAVKLLIAYGVGKPTEHHEVTGNITLEQIIAGANA